MKYIYLERLFRHLSLFQRIRLYREALHFCLDTKTKQKTQGLGNSPKMESNFLNISQTLHFVDLFLTKIRFPFLTVNHPRPILKPRSNFRGIAEEKSNSHSNTTMSPHKVLRKSTRMQNQLFQNFCFAEHFVVSATSFASFGGKIAKQSPKETRSQSGGEDINRLILFSLSLARAVALLVSLLFSYLTVTPAYGQEPVGLGKTESRDVLKKTIIDLDRAIINLTKSGLLDEKSKYKILEIYPGANLEKYPIAKIDVDTNYVPVLRIGEKISDQVLDMKLMLAESKNRSSEEMSLRDLSDKEWIILNGWADWCSPCKKSIELWEEIAPEFKDKIAVIGLHLDFDYKAPVIIERQQWTLPHVIGGEAFVLARHFLGQTIAGPSVFIHNGELYGIATVKPKDKENVIKLLNNDLSPQDESLRWFRKPLMMKGGDSE